MSESTVFPSEGVIGAVVDGLTRNSETVWDQERLACPVNIASHVCRYQFAFLSAANIANKAGDQYLGVGIMNLAKDVHGALGGQSDQVGGLVAANIAEIIDGTQISFIPTVNIAGIIDGSQYGLVNIAYRKLERGTESSGGRQIGVINYARELDHDARQFGLLNIRGPESDRSWLFTEISFGYGRRKRK